jgi:hypothetical protein
VMGTRTGDLDPGVVLFLLREKGMPAAAVDHLLNQQSGLLGVSGLSPDMKQLLKLAQEAPEAAEAVELFAYQARKFWAPWRRRWGGWIRSFSPAASVPMPRRSVSGSAMAWDSWGSNRMPAGILPMPRSSPSREGA